MYSFERFNVIHGITSLLCQQQLRGYKMIYKASGHICVSAHHLMCCEGGLRGGQRAVQTLSVEEKKRTSVGSLHNMIDAFVFAGGCNLPPQLFHCHQTNTGLNKGGN